jgi:outer membrane protein OmpA-like peptidoglycan-associated protein
MKPAEPVKPAEPAAAEPKKEEPKKEEPKKEEPKKEEPKKEEPKKDEANPAAPEKSAEEGKAELNKPAKEETKMTVAELERERARKRQVYMVPLGFRGKDPFGGSKVALSKQERAFLSKSVKFKRNVSELAVESLRHLDNVARVLRKHPNLKIEIKGFGCDLGSDEVNQSLSQSRADMVKAYLVKKKVPSRQLNAVGMGKLKPEDDIKVD